MSDDKHKDGTLSKGAAKGSRQDRLKQALRENLRRRKEQSRAQSKAQAGDGGSKEDPERPSNLHEAALDDTGGERDT